MNLKKPNIEVEEFKRDLRRSLKLSMAAPPARSWSWALPLSLGSAAFCTVMLALFIARPDLPARMNQWLGGEPAVAIAQQLPANQANSGLMQGHGDDYLNQLLAAGNATEDMDRKYIQSLYSKSEMSQPVEVKSLKGEKVFAIRQFELSGGKQVVIWTELGEDGSARRVNANPGQTF